VLKVPPIRGKVNWKSAGQLTAELIGSLRNLSQHWSKASYFLTVEKKVISDFAEKDLFIYIGLMMTGFIAQVMQSLGYWTLSVVQLVFCWLCVVCFRLENVTRAILMCSLEKKANL
jgi:hypothetical protein